MTFTNRPIEPAPLWEETPEPSDQGWAGRYRYMRQTGPEDADVDVDWDFRKAPDDMPDAVPVSINDVWFWAPRAENQSNPPQEQ